MPFIIKDNPGKEYAPAPEGMHPAVCTQIIDMGLQEGAYGVQRKIRITWEINEAMEDGRPFTVSQFFTMSLNKKAKLRDVLESWRGRGFTEEELAGFDLEKLLGAACMINVIHEHKDDRTYANIKSVGPIPKGVEKPKPVGDLLIYSCDNPDPSVLEKLPEWLGDKVGSGQFRLREEAKAKGTAAPSTAAEKQVEELDDEIPF